MVNMGTSGFSAIINFRDIIRPRDTVREIQNKILHRKFETALKSVDGIKRKSVRRSI